MNRKNIKEALSKNITVGLAVIAIAFTATATQANTGEFRLMGKALSGSKILKVDATSPVPFNKSYPELSAQQRSIFNAQFSNLNSNDRPPFPTKGLRAIYRPILNQNKSLINHGVLNMAISVDETGNVDNITVIEAPSLELERHATRALRDIKFDPASCSGEPCAMNFPIRIVLQ